MKCIYCNDGCVKNGIDRKGNQRYKCQNCKKTFTISTKRNLADLNKKRVVLHLILAGCEISDISEGLEISEQKIKKWKNLHLKNMEAYLPTKPLLNINTLIRIYQAIEKSRIAEYIFRNKRK